MIHYWRIRIFLLSCCLLHKSASVTPHVCRSPVSTVLLPTSCQLLWLDGPELLIELPVAVTDRDLNRAESYDLLCS